VTALVSQEVAVTAKPTVPRELRWIVTEKGQEAIACAPLCICDVRLVGILFACPDCGTVMGSIKEATRPRAKSWRYRA
jgi:predicted RNA-binding Zn-ribbon protein involved in translation (DUF1610 family)